MTVTEILQSVQFIVDREGKPTAAVIDIDAWEVFLAMLEDLEDVKLAQERLKNWRTKEGWTQWEEFVSELETGNVSNLAEG